MKQGSVEFEEMRNQFEKSLSEMPVYIGHHIEREPVDENKMNVNNNWYTNGTINAMFIAYMYGYQNGRIMYLY